MSFQDLSAELIHAICEVCPNETLQDLRLTCRKLREICDKHFFPEVVTCLERQDLANVRKVAECNEDIRNAVKSFTIQADRFDADIDDFHVPKEEWFEKRNLFLISLRPHFTGLQEQLTGRRLARHRARHLKALGQFLSQSHAQGKDMNLLKVNYQKYEKLANDQRKLFETPEERSYRIRAIGTASDEPSTVRVTFDKLFKACPNISAITINYKHTLRRNAGLSNLVFLNSTTIPHGGDSAVVEEVIEEVLPAACNAKLVIRDLTVAGASPYWMSPGVPYSGISSPRAKIVPIYYKAIQHLQRLHMVFNGADAEAADYDPEVDNGFGFITRTFEEGVMINWLTNCPDLQELRLVMPKAPYVNWRVEMKHIMGQIHLKSLTVLHVSGFQAEAEDIIQCLLKHKDTLRELELETAHLTDSDWPTCISAFAGKLPHLRRARLNGLFTSDGGEDAETTICFLTIPQAKEHQAELEKYMLEGTGPMPTWEAHVMEDFEDSDEGVDDENEEEDEDDEENGDENVLAEFEREDHDGDQEPPLHWSDYESDDSLGMPPLRVGDSWSDGEEIDDDNVNDEVLSSEMDDDEQPEIAPLPTLDEISSWSMRYLAMRYRASTPAR